MNASFQQRRHWAGPPLLTKETVSGEFLFPLWDNDFGFSGLPLYAFTSSPRVGIRTENLCSLFGFPLNFIPREPLSCVLQPALGNMCVILKQIHECNEALMYTASKFIHSMKP